MGLVFTKLTSGNVEVTGGEYPYTYPSTFVVSKVHEECALKTLDYVAVRSFKYTDVDSVDDGTTVHPVTTNDEFYEALKLVF